MVDHIDILNQLGLITRAQGKRVRVDDITYNRDGTIADTTMYCGFCKAHYVYDGGKDIPAACPECKDPSRWQIAIRYLVV